jgi:hypothetical protein
MSLSLNDDSGKKPLLNNIVFESDYPEFPNVSSGPDDSGLSSPLPTSGVTIGDKHHMDEIIPSKHTNRTIILCFDGTGDQFDEDVCIFFLCSSSKGISPAYLSHYSKNSNIVQFFSMLRKDNKSQQMVYYQVWKLI